MEVIKLGISAEIEANWDCSNCGSTIRSKASEGEYKSYQRDAFCIVFRCPVCSKNQWIDARRFDLHR
jgi:hypothetical protein